MQRSYTSRASEYWATWDIESTQWTKFLCGAVYDGKRKFFCTTPEELVDCFENWARPQRVYWAHCGGKFDLKFILEILLARRHIIFTVISGSMVRLKVYDRTHTKLYEIRDSFNILQFGQEQLAQTFHITPRMSLEQYSYFKKNRSCLERLPLADVQEYNMTDCIVLREILFAAKERFGIDDFKITIASQAMAHWRKSNHEGDYFVNAAHDPFLREAYYGGRTEVFRRHGTQLFHFDIHSMYPYVMKNFPYPSGKYFQVRAYDEKKLGIYRVLVHAPAREYPFLPMRSKDGKLLFPIGVWTGVYCSVELDYARKLGYTFEVIEGIVWESRSFPFRTYVDEWYARKEQAGRDEDYAMYMISKLFLNSLYGKFGQRRTFQKIIHGIPKNAKSGEIFPFMPDLDLYMVEEQERRPFTTVQIAAFVTAYARMRLYDGFLEARKMQAHIYYTDTDSIFIDMPLKSGDALGEWGYEGAVQEGIFLLPKIYAEITEKKMQLKGKGFRSLDLDIAQYRAALRGDFSKFYSRHEGLMGLLEAGRRGTKILTKRILERHLTGEFTKRCLEPDGIGTRPLVIDT